MAEGSEHYRTVLYTVGADGNDLRKILPSNLRPAWSRDGTRIAIGVQEDQSARISTARPDGSDLQEVKGPGGYSYLDDLSWSPDGSEIRFVGKRLNPPDAGTRKFVDGIHAVKADGTRERTIAELARTGPVAWSPDDTRIAVFIHLRRSFERTSEPTNVALYTVAADGSDMRVVARRNIGSGIVAEHGDWRDEHPDLSVCAAGFMVPDPQDNPRLVRDCEVLLQSRNTLAGADVPLAWNSALPISKWPGVGVKGDPPRVEVLEFGVAHQKLRGSIPPDLGGLGALTYLKFDGMGIRGPIPPELGNLTNLAFLHLQWNGISGGIPPELGNLTKLQYLRLHRNALTGDIPPELGRLTNLVYLDLSYNRLTGNIPPELARLPRLRSLGLRENEFTGCIPIELVENPTLKDFDHDGLQPC